MALKDLKSDLSKFRMPKKDPLESKERVTVNKNLNKTPLSSMVESAPKIPRSQTTTNKEGVNPKNMDNTSKFLGETTPTPSNNSEKFLGETTTKPLSLEERYLGETTPTNSDNTSKFLGETTPTKFDNQSSFLGETTPNKFDNNENFLGLTTPTLSNRESKFLGETTPNSADNTSKFLGETTPNSADNTSKFLGETTQTPSNNTSKFLGETTQTPSNNKSRFLGETTPTEVNFITDIHAKGFTSKQKHKSPSKFNGINKPQSSFDGNSSVYGKLKTSNFITDTHSTGFSLNKFHKAPSEFTGVGKTQDIWNNNSLFGNIGTVDFFPNDGKSQSRGFTLNQKHKSPSQFTGISNEQNKWDTDSSEYSSFSNYIHDDLSSAPGYGKFKLQKQSSGQKQSYNQDSTYYMDSFQRGDFALDLTKGKISKLQEMRNSPSFLDEMYSKFNLRDDAHNTGMTAFDHPLILRGIQRKGKKGNEPQNFGIPGTNIDLDDGLIRGGIITSTTRAVIDAIRLGKWMVSIKGLLWGVKQFGLQQSNPNVEKIGGIRRTKMWTPINTLASAIGVQIGLHPNRHGFTPFDLNDGSYESVQKQKAIAHRAGKLIIGAPIVGNRLVGLWKDSFSTFYGTSTSSTFTGSPHSRLQGIGGPNSVYGLIPNGKFPRRDEDTRYDVFYGNTEDNRYGTFVQTITPNPGFTDSIPEPAAVNQNKAERLKKLVESGNIRKFAGGGAPLQDAKGRNYDATNAAGDDIGKNIPGSEVINDYETIAYGDMPNRVSGETSDIDFRSLLTKDSNESNRAKKENYTEKNINARVNFGNPGKLGTGENRVDYDNTDPKKAGFLDRFDKVNASDVGDAVLNDLIHLQFKTSDKTRIQFRGTVSGITDTFSPSWDSIKYNGRADQAYQYKTFERSLSFAFKIYATSRIEMMPIYKKLSQLSKMTMPVYNGDPGYSGQLINFRLGSLFNKRQAFIESLSYSMSDETPWDLALDNNVGELPMGIDVSIGLKILGETPSSTMEKVYDTVF